MGFNSFKEESENERFFNQICLKYRNMIFKYAMEKLNNVHDAEDVTQITLLKLWNNIDNIRTFSEERMYGYIRKAVENNSSTEGKRNSKTIPIDMDEHPISSFNSEENPMLFPEVMENIELVKESINELRPMYQKVLIDKIYLNMSDEEIAKDTGLKAANVRETISRAKASLRKIYYNKTGENFPVIK